MSEEIKRPLREPVVKWLTANHKHFWNKYYGLVFREAPKGICCGAFEMVSLPVDVDAYNLAKIVRLIAVLRHAATKKNTIIGGN